MAQTYSDTDGTLVIPQANAKWATAPSNAGIATRGVVVLVGEAESGLDYTGEDDTLSGATFGPGQYAAVEAKYVSGPIVDAFRNVANPSRDPAVRGAPTQIICVKTNAGTKASGALSGGYGVVRAKAAGANGNLLSVEVVSKTAEVTASITKAFVRSTGTEAIDVAANGSTPVTLVVTAITPDLFVTANSGALLAGGITLTGGVVSQPANGLVAVTCGVTVVGNDITVTLTGGVWATQPQAGYTLAIANTSSITGATPANANSGYYIVTASSPGNLVAKKIVDLDGATFTAPVGVAPGAAAVAGTCDAYTPVTFTNSIAAQAGMGDSVTFYRPGASTGNHFYGTDAVAVAASIFAVSTVEAVQTIKVNRRNDSISSTLSVGGQVALQVGRVGATSATVTVDATSITLSGLTPMLKSNFRTLGDVAAYINAQANWYAYVIPAAASKAPSVLDYGIFKADQNGVPSTGPARIKTDANAVIAAVANSAVEFVTNPTSGLPATQATFFLAGGAKGGSTDAAIGAAFAAVGRTRCNFVVTCFSRDASADIADGLTDAASTYTIDSINAYNAAHAAEFSQFKKRRPRQAFCSKRGTFSEAKTAAQTLASARVSLSFQDVVALGKTGSQWFQPWMNAVLAAGMQAAAFYRPIFNKSIGTTGVTQAAGDFKSQDDDQVEEALLAGLLVIRARDGGGFSFVSDQTTYSADENFVYNSIQAVYVADVIAQTVAQRMERAFVGQSFADVTASVALSYLKGIMADLKRLKLITASDDAVDGYKDAKVEIRPPAMLVSAEVKEATGLYFIPISFLVTQVQQSAQQ